MELGVGGIVGHNNRGVISDSYNTGNINGSGKDEWGKNSLIGGVVGENYDGTVENCYNTGTVTGNDTAGDIVTLGSWYPVSGIDNCYYLAETETETVDGMTGKTAAQFASGELIILLQNNRSEQIWGQSLSGAAVDVSPVLSGEAEKAVYQITLTANGEEYARFYGNADGVITLPADTPNIDRIRRGSMLSDIEIGGSVLGTDGQEVPGGWSWENDREMTETGTFTETIVFSPEGAGAAPLKVQVPVTVYRSSGTSSYTVTFDSQGGSEVASARVVRNQSLTKPADPTREGYVFSGWYTDAACTEAYDFDSKVTASFTLYAKWSEAQSVWDNPFSDVEEGDWYYDAVRHVTEKGLFNGVTATTFDPNGEMTRAMLVTVLWRSEGEPGLADTVLSYPFSDVDAESWYGEAVYWARENGIVKGYSEEIFGPERLISREEMAAILERYADYKGVPTPSEGDLTRFPDGDQVSDWAESNMKWAVGAGVISGNEDGTLSPRGSATRAEVATMLTRFLEEIIG